MRRLILCRLLRIGSIVSHSRSPCSPFSHVAAFRPRFLSTTPPSAPSSSTSLADLTNISSNPQPPDSPRTLPEVISDSSSDLTEAATPLVSSDTTSFSDTLLQPAIALLNGMHDISGLPWWISIPLSTLAIRTILLPLTLMTMRNSAKMTALKGDIAERREAVMTVVRSGNRAAAAEKQKEMQQFMRDAGVAPMKVLVGPLAQFPVFISFFVGLRRLSQSEPGFTDGGVAWFVDLASRDPTYLLPILCGATLVAMTEVGGDSGSTSMTKQMRMTMRGVAVLSVPMTYWFPSAVFCYWIPNNLFSIALGSAIRTKAIKRILGLEVDLRTIKGTRAAKEYSAKLAREQGMKGPERRMDQAVAAASYAKLGGGALGNISTVKPVLLKQRPTKKKVTTSGG